MTVSIRTIWLCCCVLVVWLAGGSAGFANEEAQKQPSRILWVGNSFTSYNGGVPDLVQRLALDRLAEQGADLVFEMVTEGGAHLSDHVANESIKAPASGAPWDAVVIQGYSDEAVNPEKSDSFQQSAKTLADRTKSLGANPVYFMTWPYKDQLGMMMGVRAGYEDAARRDGAKLAPVGLAFMAASAALPHLKLYVEEDNKHPSLAGSYLAACVVFAVLFETSPEGGTAPPDIEASDAVNLQRLAWRTANQYRIPAKSRR